jgi:two-component system phosphate regulon sensor histidine kinase PhoR
MQADNIWLDTLVRTGMVLAAGVLMGLVTGELVLTLWLVTLGFLCWHLWQAFQLVRWLRRGGVSRPPEASGLWGEIFDGLRRQQRRHRQRRVHLASLLGRFRGSVNASPDAVVILRQHDEMLWWNSAAKRMLGLRWPQDTGQRINNLFRHPDFRAFLKDAGRRESVTLPSPLEPDVILEVRVVPYGEDQRLVIARDITRLYRLESMRRDFIANVSHELRTPLTVILGLTENLAEEEAADPETARALVLLQQQALRMRRLVDDLLLLSRLEREPVAGKREPVAVPLMLEALVDEANTLSGGRHSIALERDPELGLMGDEGELRSAFSNLIGNAVKYTPEGGHITVGWRRAGEGACFSVTDTGVGIPALHLPRVTERFYRVDAGRSAKTGGTGLGLAIVKHVLNRHGARLHIDSTPGAGSTFSCQFPALQLVLLSQGNA